MVFHYGQECYGLTVKFSARGHGQVHVTGDKGLAGGRGRGSLTFKKSEAQEEW